MSITCYGKKRYEDIDRLRYAYGATLVALRGSGDGRVKCTEKKRYVTLEWPIYTYSCIFLYPKKYI